MENMSEAIEHLCLIAIAFSLAVFLLHSILSDSISFSLSHSPAHFDCHLWDLPTKKKRERRRRRNKGEGAKEGDRVLISEFSPVIFGWSAPHFLDFHFEQQNSK